MLSKGPLSINFETKLKQNHFINTNFMTTSHFKILTDSAVSHANLKILNELKKE